jgi:hypothetical protein
VKDGVAGKTEYVFIFCENNAGKNYNIKKNSPVKRWHSSDVLEGY